MLATAAFGGLPEAPVDALGDQVRHGSLDRREYAELRRLVGGVTRLRFEQFLELDELVDVGATPDREDRCLLYTSDAADE